MSFKAVITEETTMISGTGKEKLVGLMCYIDALVDMGMPKVLIKEVVDLALKDNEKEDNKKVETILDNDKMKIQKFDLNNVTQEEAMKIINEEIKKMFE